MVNWQSPVTIANELSALNPSIPFPCFNSLLPAGALVKFLHVIDGIYLCVCLSFRALSLPPRKAYDQPVPVGSSFATLALSGAWLVVGVNGGGQLS